MAELTTGDEEQEEGNVYVFDRREGDLPGIKISLGGLFDFSLFKCKINEVYMMLVCPNLICNGTGKKSLLGPMLLLVYHDYIRSL